jgi:hypothetical protein
MKSPERSPESKVISFPKERVADPESEKTRKEFSKKLREALTQARETLETLRR